MSRWVYLAVLMVVLASVGVGLDWQPATLSPMPNPKFALPTPPTVPPSQTSGQNAAVNPAIPAAPAPMAVAPARPTVEPEPARRGSQVAGPLPDVTAPNCNVNACAAAYRSFVAADCSYQPLNGPRRRCQKR